MRPVGQGAAKRQLCVPKTPWSKSDPSPRTPPAPRASLTERGAGGVCAPVSSGHAQPLGNSDPATVRSPRLLLRGTMLLTAATGRSLQRRRAWDGAPSLMSRGPPFFSPAECRWLRWRMSPPLGSIVIGNEGLSGEIAGRAYSSPKVAVENAPLPPLPPLPGSLASVTFPLAPPSQTTVQLLSFPRCCAHTRFLSSVPVAGTRGPPKPSYRLFASVAASGGVRT